MTTQDDANRPHNASSVSPTGGEGGVAPSAESSQSDQSRPDRSPAGPDDANALGSSPLPPATGGIADLIDRLVADHGAPPSPTVSDDDDAILTDVPERLRLRHPDGGYVAMRLAARMLRDLNDLTGGKRAATYAEVDEYLGHALRAEGMTADWNAPLTPPASQAGADPVEPLRSPFHLTSVRDQRPAMQSVSPPGSRQDSADDARPGDIESSQAFRDMLEEIQSGGLNRKARDAGPGSAGETKPEDIERSQAFRDMLEEIGSWGPDKKAAGPEAAKAAPVQVRIPSTAPSTVAKPPVRGPKVAPVMAPVIKGPRMWPVAGNGVYAIGRAERGPNGKFYSDGRYDPKGEGPRGKSHYGLDLKSRIGAPVYSAATGTLFAVGDQMVVLRDKKTKKPLLDKKGHPIRVLTGWGHYVAIKYPDGYVVLYAHLKPPSDYIKSLRPGDRIEIGTQIGAVGNSGNAIHRGDHLHLEVRVWHGSNTLGKISTSGVKTVDPGDWMKGVLPDVRVSPSSFDRPAPAKR